MMVQWIHMCWYTNKRHIIYINLKKKTLYKTGTSILLYAALGLAYCSQTIIFVFDKFYVIIRGIYMYIIHFTCTYTFTQSVRYLSTFLGITPRIMGIHSFTHLNYPLQPLKITHQYPYYHKGKAPRIQFQGLSPTDGSEVPCRREHQQSW